MGLGPILVSLAILAGVMAYVAWPFYRDHADANRVVEAWVAHVKSERAQGTPVAPGLPSGLSGQGSAGSDEALGFCPYCGRRVEPDHVFCPKCGRKLPREGDG
jgi:hypothetical protein